jgi:hypothetical protein
VVFDGSGHVISVTFRDFEGDADVKGEVLSALQRMAASESLPSNMVGGRPWVVRLYAHAAG